MAGERGDRPREARARCVRDRRPEPAHAAARALSGTPALLRRIAEEGRRVLAEALRGRERYALIDFPDHSNVGDSAIWLGELAALGDLGFGGPAYVCDLDTYSASRLRRHLGDGVILIHGGGNLGDLWPRHQRFRERVIAEHPDIPMLQLPQSVHFDDDAALDRARRVFGSHPHLTILVRDRHSLQTARDRFDCRSELCPDLALCLPPAARSAPPSRDVQWLMRSDHEAAEGHRQLLPGNATPVDWLDEERAGAVEWAVRVERWVGASGSPGLWLEPVLWRIWNVAARARVTRGSRILCEGRAVVTDRLHAHILCLLHSIPHVVLPDRYGKIEHFLDTWTGESEILAFAPHPVAAREMASRLLEGSRPGGPEVPS